MSKVQRVDISNLTDNEELFNNNTEEFHMEEFLTDIKLNVHESVALNNKVDFNGYLDNVPKELDILSLDFNLMDTSTEGSFELTQRINQMQIVILTQTLQVLYARYKEASSPDILQEILNVSAQLNNAKKTLLDAHKDMSKLGSSSNPQDNGITVAEGGTVNIQNNFSGTPNDILKQQGDSLDTLEFEKYTADQEGT